MIRPRPWASETTCTIDKSLPVHLIDGLGSMFALIYIIKKLYHSPPPLQVWSVAGHFSDYRSSKALQTTPGASFRRLRLAPSNQLLVCEKHRGPYVTL
jgi:hypothetical protein